MLNQLSFESIIRGVSGWLQEEVSDFHGKLRAKGN